MPSLEEGLCCSIHALLKIYQGQSLRGAVEMKNITRYDGCVESEAILGDKIVDGLS